MRVNIMLQDKNLNDATAEVKSSLSISSYRNDE